MSKQRIIAHRIILILTVTILLTVPVSWMIGALGFDVNNLISGEGLRWWSRLMFLPHAIIRMELALTMALVVGACQYSGFTSAMHALVSHDKQCCNRPALAWALVLLLLFVLLLLLLVLPLSAPLRSATGRVWPSPFWLGWLRFFALGVWLSAACYGTLSGVFHRRRPWLALFYVGLQRYAPWLVVWMLGEILLRIIRFTLPSLF